MKRQLLLVPMALTLTACQTLPSSAPVATSGSAAPITPALSQPHQPNQVSASVVAPASDALQPSRPTPAWPQPNASITAPASTSPATPSPIQLLQARNYNTETLIVGLRTPAGETEAREIARRHGLRLERYLTGINSAVFATDGQHVPTVMQALKAEAQLEFVEADQIATQTAQAEIPLDNGFGLLSEESDTSQETSDSSLPTADDPYFAKQYSLPMLRVPSAWQSFAPALPSAPAPAAGPISPIVSPSLREALVGVIDAGMAIKQVDLIQTQRQGIPGNAQLASYDAYSHEEGFGKGDVSGFNYFKSSYKQGTHSAGLIAAQANNQRGIAGIAPRARVIPIKTAPDILDKIKALFAPKDETSQITQVSVLADAILWAVNRETPYFNKPGGVDILLIDTPVVEPSETLKRSIQYALSRDVVVVVPMGDKPSKADPNDRGYCVSIDAGAEPLPCGDSHASETRIYNYLATVDGVIAVGAVDQNGKLADFSATGPFISVVAPGVDVVGPVPSLLSNNIYSLRSGTTVAAAQVAGVLALMIGADKWPESELYRQHGAAYKRILQQTAHDQGTEGYDAEYGHGLIDAAAATNQALAEANDMNP